MLLRGLLAQIDLDSAGQFYFAGFSLKLLLCGVFVGAPMNILALVSVTAPHSIWTNKRLARMELGAKKQSHTKSSPDCSHQTDCKLTNSKNIFLYHSTSEWTFVTHPAILFWDSLCKLFCFKIELLSRKRILRRFKMQTSPTRRKF